MTEDPFRRIGDQWGFCVEAPVFDSSKLARPNNPTGVGTLALLSGHLQAYGKRGEAVAIAQFYDLVIPGTILTRHVFKGLQRPLRAHDDSNADREMLIYTRKPTYDCIWVGGRTGHPSRVKAPSGCVFVVIVMPNTRHQQEYPEVSGWINAWTWIEEDHGLPEAPIDWVDRYDLKVWTREGSI